MVRREKRRRQRQQRLVTNDFYALVSAYSPLPYIKYLFSLTAVHRVLYTRPPFDLRPGARPPFKSHSVRVVPPNRVLSKARFVFCFRIVWAFLWPSTRNVRPTCHVGRVSSTWLTHSSLADVRVRLVVAEKI